MQKSATMHLVLAGVFLFVLISNSVNSAEQDGKASVKLEGEVSTNVSKRPTVEEIESIGVTELEILDPFDSKTNRYKGIWLDQFAAHFAKPGVTHLTFIAIDEYEISFERKEWTNTRILLVTKVNDKYIDLEHKGPLRIIFPDFNPKTDNSKENLPKWIWMITRVQFK